MRKNWQKSDRTYFDLTSPLSKIASEDWFVTVCKFSADWTTKRISGQKGEFAVVGGTNLQS